MFSSGRAAKSKSPFTTADEAAIKSELTVDMVAASE